jgi:hypothetical protein
MAGIGAGIVDMTDWLAGQVNQIGQDTLNKTQAWNPSADAWRPLRAEDIGLTEHTMGFSVTPGTYTIVSNFQVPSGMGIQFAGWFLDSDLGYNSYLAVYINGVKRQEVAGHVIYNQGQYKAFFTLEQVCYAKQNDKITLQMYNSGATTVNATVWPIAFIAGEAKTLLIE